ncbi:hypothetical protein GUITHDRAFT_155348 [Guillardia theta CCMP2712]|uniref:Uncharacterized protein n=1 Tax=Guillardia theta (strain CCMP2712) TaxID=905079 RepID=L1IJ45_GUITC|nr:hypothetical protein GUITHDRAFT_155348 [Guillardia theta CCMP2712]EKX35939.1 hypothetical protein GUITHDRAFT_155348 [Guillardia theta CCMP2712]|eukprot:XP_005822919.1 hypothetical protein GUITHDRAFT_155348 [Guillardia theta CCMP2712]
MSSAFYNHIDRTVCERILQAGVGIEDEQDIDYIITLIFHKEDTRNLTGPVGEDPHRYVLQDKLIQSSKWFDAKTPSELCGGELKPPQEEVSLSKRGQQEQLYDSYSYKGSNGYWLPEVQPL